MQPERWQEIRSLFEETIRHEPRDRASFLDKACAHDSELKRHVEQLLRAEQESNHFLEPPRADEMVRFFEDPPEERMEQVRIGSYQIRRLIASGGMGRVYEAEQQNPQRMVALKMLRYRLATTSALRRFRHESDLLARLRHPAIAQIYEAGTHIEGAGPTRSELPYFAMEYVEGAQDIVSFSQSRALSLRARIALFIRVCDGVQHGHQRGVIHRDLKPANILVDLDGQPKVIDFGVARLVDDDVAARTRLTEAGQVMGTVQYMSPEQLESDPQGMDTRSDIYSLGVCLYELLTGRLPYDTDQQPMHRAARIITETEPVSPGAVDRALANDLEWIVMKAMNKDREQRYAAVSELAGDLHRYLSNEPVQAGPPGAAYQVRKFIRRHRTGVVAGVFVLLALLCGMGGILIGLIEAREQQRIAEFEKEKAQEAKTLAEAQRDRARKEVLKSRSLVDFLGEMFSCASPWEDGRHVKVVDILNRSASKIEEALGHEPEVEALL
ncbi:MAG: serine/threonine-protein kinase, partial [Planctomycetota bacterium]